MVFVKKIHQKPKIESKLSQKCQFSDKFHFISNSSHSGSIEQYNWQSITSFLPAFMYVLHSYPMLKNCLQLSARNTFMEIY